MNMQDDYIKSLKDDRPLAILVWDTSGEGGSEKADAFIAALTDKFKVLDPLERCSDLLSRLFNTTPALIVISQTVGDMNALAFMRRLKQTIPFGNTCFILLCEDLNDSIEGVCNAFSIDGAVSINEAPKDAANRIFEIYESVKAKAGEGKLDSLRSMIDDPLYFTDKALEDVVFESITESVLMPLGFSEKHAGTRYLQLLVSMRILGADTSLGEAYRYIAESYRTTPAAVEKAIRYSIESAWSKGSPFMQQKLFGNSVDASKGKPTNAEFVETVVRHELDRLRATANRKSLN